MAISDSKRRELCALLAFREQFNPQDPELSMGILMETLTVTRKNVFEAIAQLQDLQPRLPAVREKLEEISVSYSVDRLGAVEQAILLLAADELLRNPEGKKQIISDAIRLARKYASPEAGSLVNALLDGLYQQSEGAKVDEPSIASSLKALEQAEADAHEAHLRQHQEGRASS
jgi:transcription termination factor NusB